MYENVFFFLKIDDIAGHLLLERDLIKVMIKSMHFFTAITIIIILYIGS